MGKDFINPLSAKFIKWSNTLKQIVGKLPTICLSVFDHFSGLALKELRNQESCVLNGGTSTKYFLLGRGARQCGDLIFYFSLRDLTLSYKIKT